MQAGAPLQAAPMWSQQHGSYTWTDLDGRTHLWRQVSGCSLVFFALYCNVFYCYFFAFCHNQKNSMYNPVQAEKSKTGYQNKLACLIGLFHCGEYRLLEQQLARLKTFGPLQQQLQRLVAQYNLIGTRAFFDLGYIAPEQ